MKSAKRLLPVFSTILILVCFLISISGQTADDRSKVANISSLGSSVRWDITAPNAGATLTVSAPDGRVFSKMFKTGSVVQFSITDDQGERLPDGQYTYELRLATGSAPRKDSLSNGRGKEDEPESVRAAHKNAAPAQSLVESGSFSILNGSVIVAGATEPGNTRAAGKVSERRTVTGEASTGRSNFKLHHLPRFMPDDVIPDDLIVQGSACVGLDCVNGEVFGFDTIRLKENNTRLQFEDTSAAGFPLNNWQIRANSSGAGGASFLAFVDQGAAGNSETGTIVFEVDAGAPANALKVSSTGKVGLRTATPVLDVHITSSDTPAHRLEQTNAGGFTAQTWDIAGNEANFFVRDVTSGSRLPFRIRPGAPTSSVDISANGNVGVGTASPRTRLDVKEAEDSFIGGIHLRRSTTNDTWALTTASDNNLYMGYATDASLADSNADFTVFPLILTSNNRVGIGTAAPDQKLSVSGDASKSVGGGSWQVFSDERLKNIKGNFSSGLKAIMQLQPIRYQYKPDNPLKLQSEIENVGFGAQALQKVIPQAVSKNGNGYLMVNNDPILWTMLNAIKEQQKEIEKLKGEVRQLRAARRRR
jgi:endosialidase-like protein